MIPRKAEERSRKWDQQCWEALAWPEGISVVPGKHVSDEDGRGKKFSITLVSSRGPIITQPPRVCLTTCPWHWIRFIKCLESPEEKAAQDKHSDCYFGILSQPDPTEVKKVYFLGMGQPHVSGRWSVRFWESAILISFSKRDSCSGRNWTEKGHFWGKAGPEQVLAQTRQDAVELRRDKVDPWPAKGIFSPVKDSGLNFD
jgi:hypothetical protein